MSKHLKLDKSVLAVTLLALTAGCGGGSSPANENAASVNATASAGNGSAEGMPGGPFAPAEMQMHEAMMAATGANASETWVRKMIEHHRGAVAMSQVLVDGGGDQQFVDVARQIATKQQREIGELERMLAAGISGGSGQANPYGDVDQRMHRQMMAATGANLTETWARKMIAHHQGAVAMSEVLIRQGGAPQVLAAARRTVDDQRREVAQLEAMLRGEAVPAATTPAAAAPPAAKSAPPAPAKESPRSAPARTARETSAAPRATPASRPAERDKAAPRPSPSPEPAPAPKATCTPEHRAMGHC